MDFTEADLRSLEEALRTIRRDLRASGIHRTLRVIIPEHALPAAAFIEIDGDHEGGGQGIAPSCTADLAHATVAVAGSTQDALADIHWQVWPVCPTHHLGAHPAVVDDKPVWTCPSGPGHILSAIGDL